MNKLNEYTENTSQFVKDIELEVKRITWPNRNETLKSTIAVFTISALFALFLALADYIFSLIIGSILS